jgi:hypothetical protein
MYDGMLSQKMKIKTQDLARNLNFYLPDVFKSKIDIINFVDLQISSVSKQ